MYNEENETRKMKENTEKNEIAIIFKFFGN